MRMIFGTDLHGDQKKFQRLAQAAAEYGAAAIVIGGDIAPKFVADIFRDQTKFYRWLRKWADSQIIPVYTYLGNDDVKCLLDIFLEECRKSRNLHLLDAEGEIEGLRYVRYNYVPDTPFGLKDWSRRDAPNWQYPVQYSQPCYSEVIYPGMDQKPIYRFHNIKNLADFLNNLHTIEYDLSQLKLPVDIAFIHAPPSGLSLDVCWDGHAVGSDAILNWLNLSAPLVSFHGHIHENYKVTGIWRNRIDTPVGLTWCVQPGDKHFVVADIEPSGSLGRGNVNLQIKEY